ncbi:MAG: 4,5-DOPA dioxygenase extradiol [Anaerolineae bacterium]|nr:4,5-DOPA dioxygenase extradiol [Anaerolineae bacterium]
MPVLFIGHGSPMNAVEDNEFSRAWIQMGQSIPRPTAILCISAHWETPGTSVTSEENPRTIYDFFGFPPELYQQRYNAPGDPALAKTVADLVPLPVKADTSWGLDHGAWSVLCRLFPKADIPVVQLGLNQSLTPEQHYDLARSLRPLRDQGVLILGSGNMVHNLRVMRWNAGAFEWAAQFDSQLKNWIDEKDHTALVNYTRAGQAAALSIPTNEHYLPLLYTLALQDAGEQPEHFAEGVVFGSISMRSLRIG